MEMVAAIVGLLLVFAAGLVAGTAMEKVRGWCRETRPTCAIRWTLGGASLEGKDVRMNLHETEKVSAEFAPKKPDGSPGAIDGAATLTLDPPDSLTVEVDPGGLKFELKGKPTQAPVAIAVVITGDADLGEGVRPITASGSILLLPTEADHAEIVFGTPEPQA